MISITENATPMMMASVRSNTTVAAMVMKNFIMPPLNLCPKMKWMFSQSFILHAVTIRTPASADSGIADITGASMNIDNSRMTAWNIPASLVSQPALMATLVLAMAAVAGTPPNSGITRLPIPCAISSLSASISSSFILPADAPQSKLSIMPRAAMENAGMKRFLIWLMLRPASVSLSSRMMDFGTSPTTATSNCRKWLAMRMIMSAANDDGNLALSFFGHISIMMITANPISIVSISGWKPLVKYEITLTIARSPSDVTPKKLSS